MWTSSPRRKILQDVLAGDAGEDAQLDLRVVGRDQPGHPRPRSRSGSRGPAPSGSGRSGGSGCVREPAGRRRGLAERGEAAGARLDQLGKRVEVGGLQLRQLAPVLDLLDDRMLAANRLEHAGVGREPRLAAALLRQAELVEEDLRQLLRRADGELLSRQFPDLALQFLDDPLRDPARDLGDPRDVELHAGPLHLDQHVDERQLHLLQQPGEPEPSPIRVTCRSASARVPTARSARPSAFLTEMPMPSSPSSLSSG